MHEVNFFIDSLDITQKRISSIKDTLGLYNDKKKKDDFFKYISLLKEKFALWLEENQGSRSLTCPFCSKMVMLKIKMDKWDAIKHPYFKDKLLVNEHALALLKEKTITALDYAKIIQGKDVQSTDYTDWILEKLQKPTHVVQEKTPVIDLPQIEESK